jgi:PIN domain nuclease of toxin-antitoxin system
VTFPSALLLDTHAAIWLAEGMLQKDALDKVIHAGLADGVYVSAVTAWEVGLLARPRAGDAPAVQFRPDPGTWFAALLAKPIMRLAPLTPEAAIDSSFLPGTFHNDPADRLLVATARAMNIPLMTRDGGIQAYARQGHVRTEPC